MEHKHKDLIIAWANGAKIQVLIDGAWCPTTSPAWLADYKYRVKPTPKPDVIKYFNLYNMALAMYYPTLTEAVDAAASGSIGVVQLVLNGETGMAKRVELMHV